MIWLWRDTGDATRVAAPAQSTFWYVLPSLPLLLVLPAFLRNGVAFWLSLVLACAMTIALYALTFWLLPRLGVEL